MSLLRNNFCDVILSSYDDYGGEREIQSHKIILASKFPFFYCLFTKEEKKNYRMWIHDVALFGELIDSLYDSSLEALILSKDFSDASTIIRMAAFLGKDNEDLEEIVSSLDLQEETVDSFFCLLSEIGMKLSPDFLLRELPDSYESPEVNEMLREVVILASFNGIETYYQNNLLGECSEKIVYCQLTPGRKFITLSQSGILKKWTFPSLEYLETIEVKVFPPLSLYENNLAYTLNSSVVLKNRDIKLEMDATPINLSFTENGNFLVAVSELGTIYKWETKNYSLFMISSIDRSFFQSILRGTYQISIASQYLSSLENNVITVYSLSETPEKKRSIKLDASYLVSIYAISSNLKKVAYSNGIRGTRILDLESGRINIIDRSFTECIYFP